MQNIPSGLSNSNQMILKALIERGYSVSTLDLHRRLIKLTAPGGSSWLMGNIGVSYPFVPHTIRTLCRDKQLSYELAAMHDVAIPPTWIHSHDGPVPYDKVAGDTPLVVKPLDGYGSHGVTLHITDEHEYARALAEAQEHTETVVVQKQVAGTEIRFTIINGKVVSVLNRESPRVTGDGNSTVKELIAAENDIRKKLQFDYAAYPQLDSSNVPEHFLQDDSVPAKGQVIEFSQSTLLDQGSSLHDITEVIDASYIDIAERLAGAVHPQFLVIDMLIVDFRQPASLGNYAFLEFNTAPSLRLYYSVRSGKVIDIVPRLAGMIDRLVRQAV